MRVAICGAQHPHVFPRIQLLQARDDVELLGVHEPEDRVREHIETEYGLHSFGSLDELIAAGPELAVVQGFDHENPDYVPALAEAGCDLLIEKPGANVLSRMREMVAAVEKTGVHAEISYMLRHSPTVPRLLDLVDKGALGHITLARFHASSPIGCAGEIWQSLPDDIGGVAYTDGCHMVDLIQRLLGQPQAVQGLVKRVKTKTNAKARYFKPDILSGLGGEADFTLSELVHEDCAGAIFDYPDTVAVFDVTGWEAHGWVEEWRIELYGTKGTVYAGILPPWTRLYLDEAAHGFEAGWTEIRDGDAPVDKAELTLTPDITYQTEMDQLFERLARGDRSQQGLRDGLAVVETLDGMFRSSADTGRRVEL